MHITKITVTYTYIFGNFHRKLRGSTEIYKSQSASLLTLTSRRKKNAHKQRLITSHSMLLAIVHCSFTLSTINDCQKYKIPIEMLKVLRISMILIKIQIKYMASLAPGRIFIGTPITKIHRFYIERLYTGKQINIRGYMQTCSAIQILGQ